jgi:hypothetical protein
MFEKLLGGLVDKEAMAYNSIQEALVELAEELDCKYTDLFIMIKPFDKEMNFKGYLYQLKDGKNKVIRELTIKEIIGD